MLFIKVREKRTLLKFFYDAYTDSTRQSENRIEEIDLWIKPPINRGRLKIYLIEFLEKGWIEWDKERPKAYVITAKGRVYHSSSWWSNLTTNQQLAIISMIATAVVSITIASLGFYLSHIGYFE